MAQPWDPRSDQSRLEAAQRLDPRAHLYGVSPETAVELLRLQQGSGGPHTSTESIFAALPTASSVGEFAKTGIFADARDIFQNEADSFYVSSNNEFNNLAEDPRNYEEAPAPITVVPTSTTNPKRPRTVAAGYRPGTSEDGRKGTLTVIFRDGTFYNYYEVSPNTWYYFKLAKSKGKFIRKYLDSHPRGYVDTGYESTLTERVQYKIARTNQMLYEGAQGMRPLRQPSLQRRLLMQERAERRIQRLARGNGKNPASGKNPAVTNTTRPSRRKRS